MLKVELVSDKINEFGHRELLFEAESPENQPVEVPKKKAKQLKLSSICKEQTKDGQK